jgi:hypothetical protein
VAGTIIADVIQSDQSYPSSINIASPVIISNKVQMGTVSSANARFAAAGGIEFTSARSGSPYGAIIDYAPGASQGRVCVASGNTFGVQIGGTEYARFSTVGLDLSAGSAQGIKFPATQAASSDANTLDDYEEGTWTPTFSSTGASFSYTDQYGSYTKVGRMVLAQFYIRASASGTTSNIAEMTGLPFTSANLNALHQSGGGLWFSGTTCQPLVQNNSTRVELWKEGAIAINLASDISGKYLVGMVMYQAA